MDTEKSSARALTIARQLAQLKLTRFFSEGSGLTASTPLGEVGIKWRPGAGVDTEGGPVAELAWEIALTAQSFACLAVELQVWAEKYADREPISADSTYKRLYSSLGILRGLLNIMRTKCKSLNETEGNKFVCVISEPLVEEILSMWAADNLITLVECMTSKERAETPDTRDAGGMK